MNATITYHRWVKENADLGTGPIAIEPCYSNEYFERERQQIFKRTWLMIGREEDVPKPGAYFVHNMAVADTSILVVRGRDAKIRAFHNMCPHRGNRLVWNDKGCAKGVFVCPFHSWSFDTTGKLRGVTDEANFFDLNKSKLGLTEVACDTWAGFIFINLDRERKEALVDYLGGVAVQLKDYPFSELHDVFGYIVDERANWKVVLDAQNEVYHAPYLHSAGAGGDMFAPNEQNSVRMHAFQRFGRHSMYATAANPNQTVTPVESFLYRTGPGPFAGDAIINGNFNFYVLFPNSVIALLPGGMVATYRLWPLAPERTLWEIRVYTRTPKNAGEALMQTYLTAFTRDTLQEDAAGHERIQSMLKSGATSHFILQDEEVQIRFFHKVVDDHVLGVR